MSTFLLITQRLTNNDAGQRWFQLFIIFGRLVVKSLYRSESNSSEQSVYTRPERETKRFPNRIGIVQKSCYSLTQAQGKKNF